MGEVGDIAFANMRAVPIGLAEVDGFVGFAVGGGPRGAGEIHVHIIKGKQGTLSSTNSYNMPYMHVYKIQSKFS